MPNDTGAVEKNKAREGHDEGASAGEGQGWASLKGEHVRQQPSPGWEGWVMVQGEVREARPRAPGTWGQVKSW